MFGINWQGTAARRLLTWLIAIVSVVGLVGCGDRLASSSESPTQTASPPPLVEKISEVSPPPTIQTLRNSLDTYRPQVAILSPKPNELLQDTTVTVQLRVRDLPIFLNPDLGLGPHLDVILDNQPYTMVYDLNQPLVFQDLAPGTHTLRVFASRPWHESFKNEGAYAQTTFHIFTKTQDNNPDPTLPLLTYSRPIGTYGAEPIMLDFYLTNAPLHFVAQENPDDEVADWRIRVTVNGQSFVLDRWEPIYLKGFQPGNNWVQLAFLDEKGNPVKNAFNNTVRLITYEPKGQDTLSKLVRGELSAADARGLVDPNYVAKTPIPAPEPTLTPIPSPTPETEATPTPETETIPTPETEVTPEASSPETTPSTLEETPADRSDESEPMATSSPETASQE